MWHCEKRERSERSQWMRCETIQGEGQGYAWQTKQKRETETQSSPFSAKRKATI